jgi:hypothetical protein
MRNFWFVIFGFFLLLVLEIVHIYGVRLNNLLFLQTDQLFLDICELSLPEDQLFGFGIGLAFIDLVLQGHMDGIWIINFVTVLKNMFVGLLDVAVVQWKHDLDLVRVVRSLFVRKTRPREYYPNPSLYFS